MKRKLILFTLLLLLGFNLLAQSKVIIGTVTDANNGQLLPGVTVMVSGTSIGVFTGLEGKYAIEVPDDAEKLSFKFAGMKHAEVWINDQSVIDIALEEDMLKLNEVIITGYASREKNQLTGSVVQVSGDDIKDMPVVSVDQTLQGRVPGLVISSTSGVPGSWQDIRIRGVGSLAAGNEPLFVIDGVPTLNGDISSSRFGYSTFTALSAFNSSDIESITVLKDAAATSAYGARGSNGVIVITTRKGGLKKTTFNVSLSQGFQNHTRPGPRMMTAQERMEQYLDGVFNSFGADYDFTREEAYDWAVDNNLRGISSYVDWKAAGSKNGDWEAAITNKNAPLTIANISVSGGDKISSFYASLGYNKTETTIHGPVFNRVSGSLNYNRKLTQKIHFSTTNRVSNTLQDMPFTEHKGYSSNPLVNKFMTSPLYQPYNDDGEANIDLPGRYVNYLYLKDHDENFTNTIRIIHNTKLSWEIIGGLRFQTKIGLDYFYKHFKQYRNRYHGLGLKTNGFSNFDLSQVFTWVAQNSLDYDIQKNGHRVQFKALMEFQDINVHNFLGWGIDFPADGLTNISSAGGERFGHNDFGDGKNLSYLGMVNYNYQSKYIADFTYRREGSSRFPTDNRFGNFWAIGLAWNMHKEAFLSKMKWIAQLRLRGSYGISGNSEIPGGYQTHLNYGISYAGSGGAILGGYGNPNLNWEKNRNFDIGLEFALWDSRIAGSVDYFQRHTFDLLKHVSLPLTSGHSSILQNGGAIDNDGLECMLNANLVRLPQMRLDVSANIAFLRGIIKKRAKDPSGQDIVEVGDPIQGHYTRTWAGVNPANGDPQWYVNGKDGELTNDLNRAKVVYQNGSAIPKYTGGLGLQWEVHRFFLHAHAYFAVGHLISDVFSVYTWHAGLFTTESNNGVAGLRDAWKQPGDITDVPRQVHDDTGHGASFGSTRFTYEGDYIRLRDLVLGYRLPVDLNKKLGFDKMSLTVRGTNFFTWVKDDRLQYDPEVGGRTGIRLSTPPVKSITVGLNLNF